MDQIIKDYILSLLELEETKLKCINFGIFVAKNEKGEVELNMIKAAKEIVKREL